MFLCPSTGAEVALDFNSIAYGGWCLSTRLMAIDSRTETVDMVDRTRSKQWLLQLCTGLNYLSPHTSSISSNSCDFALTWERFGVKAVTAVFNFQVIAGLLKSPKSKNSIEPSILVIVVIQEL